MWLQGADYLSYLGHSVIYFRVVEQNRLPSWLISWSPPGLSAIPDVGSAAVRLPLWEETALFFLYTPEFSLSLHLLHLLRMDSDHYLSTHTVGSGCSPCGASLCSSSSVCFSLWPPGLLLNVHLPLHSQGAGLIFFPGLHRAVEHSSSLFILGFAFYLVAQGLLYDVESLPLLRSPCLQQTREAHGVVSPTRSPQLDGWFGSMGVLALLC